MAGRNRSFDDNEQQILDWIAEGNPNVGRFEDESSPPSYCAEPEGDTGPILPGTLHAHEYYSPAKLKSILAAMLEREQDPLKLVAWKIAVMKFFGGTT